MKKEQFCIEGKNCTAYINGKPEFLLIQPVDDHDLEGLDRQIETLSAATDASFVHIAFKIEDWNRELSPWPAPPVFGREGFGEGAEETLRFVRSGLIDYAIRSFELTKGIPVVLGGYSLAGFFALWSAYQTDLFSGIAAVSPSV